MTHSDVYEALDILREYPEITDYIKSFDGNGGFMYTTETHPQRIAIKKQMETLLDDGRHSGCSWGCMMRIVQAVLNGLVTVEQLQEQDRLRQLEYQKWLKSKEEAATAAAAAALIKEENAVTDENAVVVTEEVSNDKEE